MAALFGGGKKKSSTPKPTPAPTVIPTPAQQNGAAMGAGTNYGNSNQLGGTSSITRGTFLGS